MSTTPSTSSQSSENTDRVSATSEREVLVSIAVGRPVGTPFTYRLPKSLGETLEKGRRVVVPFGRSQAVGFSLGEIQESRPSRLKDVIRVLDDGPLFDDHMLQLLSWAARYYRHPLGEVLRSALPHRLSGMNELPEEKRANSARQKWVALTETGRNASSRGKKLQALIDYLNTCGKPSVTIEEIRAAIPDYHAPLRRLEELGHCTITFADREKASVDGALTGEIPPHPTEEQVAALSTLNAAIDENAFAPFLLHGVTGSGKTEVYLRAIQRVLSQGKGALVLVPEISLTPQLVGRFQARFGDQVALLHSGLHETERLAQWLKLKSGRASLAVGVRSAIFAPVPNLGLIVVDEEHDGSFKQEDGFRYSARDLAVVRANLLGCPVVLGSATPSFETLWNAKSGRYGLLKLAHRVDDRPMPSVSLVDLRDSRGHMSAAFPQMTGKMRLMSAERQRLEDASLISTTARVCEPEVPYFSEGGRPGTFPIKAVHVRPTDDRPLGAAPLISNELKEAIDETLQRHRQTILFLNRRGMTTFHLCMDCGQSLKCPNCAVSLTLHQRKNELMCHYCGERFALPDVCPNCRGHIERLGMGTEQVEMELSRLFPMARIERLDRDNADTPEAITRRLSAFARGETDILIGTQMVAKGHDFPGVLLVGVLLADMALNLPDFRAAERTFQLIAQVAGRAGRGREPGRVIVQTFSPDAPAIAHVTSHNFDGFSEGDLDIRRRGFFPPFSRLACLRIDGIDPKLTERVARELAKVATEVIRAQRLPVRVQGPAPAPISMIKGRHRWQILLKSPEAKSLGITCDGLERTMAELSKNDLKISVDVDPMTLL